MIYEYWYEPELKKTIDLLNKINMTPFLTYDITPYELANRIEYHIWSEPELAQIVNEDPEYFEDEVFNQMSYEDLMEYIHANYGVKFKEIVEYRLR